MKSVLFGAIAVAALQIFATSPAWSATLEDVKARGNLVCGVSEGLPGFSDRDADGAWHGFDVDFCRAVAAAILGDSEKVEYVPLSTTERFEALTDAGIDLLSRNSTWTLSRDTGLDIEFAGVAYYDGQGFLTQAAYGVRSALQLQGARICVLTGTTTEANAAAYFAGKDIPVTFLNFDTRPDMRKAYEEEACDAMTADRSALAAERSLMEVPDDHVILPEVISKEPLGPVTRDGDPEWTDIVRWTLYGLINAEELGLTSATMQADDGVWRDEALALGKLAAQPLHLDEDWLVRVISQVGNYGEIFERNLGVDTPLGIDRGINAAWNAGGILYAPPMQ